MQGQGSDLGSILLAIQRLVDKDEPGVLAVVTVSTGSAPGKVGAKMLVLPDGRIRGTVGGGVIEARVTADALDALKDGLGPRSRHYELAELGMSCGGEMAVYFETLQSPRRVIVFGAGHVGTAVARQLSLLGCALTVVDDRAEWANRERLPDRVRVVNQPFATYLAESPAGPKDHVVIVTRGHEHDQLVLETVVASRPAYLGMIGSRKKAEQALARLRQGGVPEELLGTVRSPMGLDIGAVTPEEIAVSLAAELIALWRRGGAPDDRIAASMCSTVGGMTQGVADPGRRPPPRDVRPRGPGEVAP